MHLPTAAELIGAWERGAAQQWVDRGLTLLAAGYPEKTLGQLQALTVGERDCALMELRAGLFGPSLNCYAECPRCEARLEFLLDAKDLLTRAAPTTKQRAYEMASNGLRVRFCAPNSEDLAELPAAVDLASARRILFERCILEASRDNEPLAVEEIPQNIVDEVASALAQSESQADTSVALQCVSCTHHWDLAFDIVSFLWAEISSVAKRCLGEVHTLAWAYGWREADILAMSPARRQFYLERVGNG